VSAVRMVIESRLTNTLHKCGIALLIVDKPR